MSWPDWGRGSWFKLHARALRQHPGFLYLGALDRQERGASYPARALLLEILGHCAETGHDFVPDSFPEARGFEWDIATTLVSAGFLAPRAGDGGWRLCDAGVFLSDCRRTTRRMREYRARLAAKAEGKDATEGPRYVTVRERLRNGDITCRDQDQDQDPSRVSETSAREGALTLSELQGDQASEDKGHREGAQQPAHGLGGAMPGPRAVLPPAAPQSPADEGGAPTAITPAHRQTFDLLLGGVWQQQNKTAPAIRGNGRDAAIERAQAHAAAHGLTFTAAVEALALAAHAHMERVTCPLVWALRDCELRAPERAVDPLAGIDPAQYQDGGE